MSDDKKIDPIDDDTILNPQNREALSPEDRLTKDMEARKEAATEMKSTILKTMRLDDAKPVQPVKMTNEDSFKFRCHKGVSCWNECCHGADVTLTPMDIQRLAKQFWATPAKIMADYVVPSMHEGSNLPVAKLVMTGKDGKGPCVFMDEDTGCTVYENRPATCRYYPLGLGAMKLKGHAAREDMYFLVKESHCKGHDEDHEQSVGEFRKEQGVEPYDLLNERWIDILMKMASWRSIGGPEGRDVSKQTKKMFYMISTDIDAFRRFVLETKFLEVYEIDDDMVASIKKNDEALLQLGFDWLSSVMFNENTIGMKQPILQDAIAKARRGNDVGS